MFQHNLLASHKYVNYQLGKEKKEKEGKELEITGTRK